MFNSLISRFITVWKILPNERIKKVLGFIIVIVPLFTIFLLLLINLKKPWEFDESYNLQIVQNLRSGNGYATNGAFRGSGPYLFDPYISTGPSVLLPIWVISSIVRDTLLAARLVMFSYFLCMLVLLYRLTPRSNFGRFTFGIMLMALLPTIIATNPLFVLGEPVTIIYFLLATVAVKRESTTLTGIALAGVVLSKLNFTVAALVFLLLVIGRYALDKESDTKRFFKRTLRLVSGFVAPLLAFEIYRLVSLGGVTAYRTNIRELRNFVDTQRLQHWSDSAGFLGAKITSLINIPGSFVWTALGLSIVGLCLTIMTTNRRQEFSQFENSSAFTPALISGVLVLSTFLFLSSAPFERQAASSFYLIFPLIILVSLQRIRVLMLEQSFRVRLIGFSLILMISIPLGLRTLNIFSESIETVKSSAFGVALEEQQHAANIVRDSGATSIMLDGWFQNPDYQLLSGIPAASMPESSMKTIMVVSAIKYSFTGTYEDFLNQKDLCNEVLYSSESLLVCWPKND